MLEKKPEDRPASARDVLDRLSLFRSAGTTNTTKRVKSSSSPRGEAASPPGAQMSGRPSVTPSPAASSGDTKPSSRIGEPAPAPSAKKEPLPRTDTIALVQANASKGKEIPTWLAVAAIVLLSLVAGMGTYLVRLKTSEPGPAASTTTTAGPKALASNPR